MRTRLISARRAAAAGAAACAALLATPAAAQLPLVDVGATVGAAVPQGGFSDAAATGLVVNGLVGVRLAGLFGLRGELLWSRSDLDSPLIRNAGGAVLPPGDADVSGTVDMIGGIANLVISPATPVVQPYLIGGVGLYRRRVAQNVSGTIEEFRRIRESDSNLGFNGGVGLRFALLGYAAFVEARYHAVQTDPERTNFIPVSAGFAF